MRLEQMPCRSHTRGHDTHRSCCDDGGVPRCGTAFGPRKTAFSEFAVPEMRPGAISEGGKLRITVANWPRRDCFVAPLLAMTAICSVIASKAK